MIALKHPQNLRGFTLLELLIGAVVMALISTLSYSALWGTIQAQKSVESRAEIQDQGTALINKLKDELTQTFFVDANRPLTQFKGTDNGLQDRIKFTAIAHYPSSKDAHESDQTELIYKLDSNPDIPNAYILKRHATSFLNTKLENRNLEPPESEFMTLSKNILKFNLEYFDGEKYFPAWDIESPEHRNKLPKLVKIALTLINEREQEFNFQTVVQLAMSESLALDSASRKKPTTNNTNQNPDDPQNGTPQNSNSNSVGNSSNGQPGGIQ